MRSELGGERDRKLPLAAIATAVAVSLLCLIAGALAPLVDRDEPRYADVVRAMRESGDLLVPRSFGELFVEKPPLLYWLQVASTEVLGKSEMALRAPSALAAGLIVVLAAAIARRLGGDPAVAGTVVTPGVLIAGFFATPDALTCTLTALSLLGFLRAADGDRPASSAAVGWTALAAGVLAKGPIAPLFVASALAGRLWRDRPAWRRLGWAWGAPLSALIVLAWFLPANLATSWEVARVGVGLQVVQRALQPLQHHGLGGPLGVVLGPPFYLVALTGAALPASLRLPAFWHRRHELPPLLIRTTLSGIFLPLAALSLAVTKLPHYILPALPLTVVAASATAIGPKLRRVGWITSAAALVLLVGIAHLAPWREIAGAVKSSGGACATSALEPSLRYYAGPALRPCTEGELASAALRGPVRVLLLASEAVKLHALVPPARVRELGRWSGWNLAKGRRESWTLVELERSP